MLVTITACDLQYVTECEQMRNRMIEFLRKCPGRGIKIVKINSISDNKPFISAHLE